MGATIAALALFLLALVAGAVFELARSTLVAPPRSGVIWLAIRLSLYTATVSSLLAVAVALPIAYGLARHEFRGKNLLDTLLDLPLVLSPVALGALLLVFFSTPAGRAIQRVTGPFVFEVRGIILAQFMVVVGLAIRLLKTAFEGVDPDYEKLARTLGLNRMQVFRRVALPLAGRGVLAAALLVWARAIGEFGATVTLAGAMPGKTATIPVAIYLSFESADVGGMIIFILILIGVSLATLYAVRKIGLVPHA